MHDDDGGFTEYSATIALSNVPPTATLQVPTKPVPEGSAFPIALIKPVDAAGDLPSLEYAFDCGGGGGLGAFGSSASQSSTTSDNGTRVVGAVVRDKDGASSSAGGSVAVFNVPPAVVVDSVQQLAFAPRGRSIWYHFTDPGPSDGGLPNNFWSGAISVASGKSTTSYFASGQSGLQYSWGYNFLNPGQYTVTVSFRDKDGALGVEAVQISIK